MNDLESICPCCGEGKLLQRNKNRKITYLGVKGETITYYSVCTYCETEQACRWQVEVNRDNMLTFHRTVERFVRDKK